MRLNYFFIYFFFGRLVAMFFWSLSGSYFNYFLIRRWTSCGSLASPKLVFEVVGLFLFFHSFGLIVLFIFFSHMKDHGLTFFVQISVFTRRCTSANSLASNNSVLFTKYL